MTNIVYPAMSTLGANRTNRKIITNGTTSRRVTAVKKLVACLVLVMGALTAVAYVLMDSSGGNSVFVADRLLEEVDPSDEASCYKADTWWSFLLHLLGALYLLLAIAVVVDESFVPALEELSSERHLNLSMDVAGATIMAAGGSAPELFISFLGTFKGSDVGFGTIVGSAVFNVLFVIAFVAFFSKETLKLTWWPLFRDSLCYVLGLIVLAVLVGVVTPERVYIWEASVLLGMYLCYILVMGFNTSLHKLLTGRDLYPEEPPAHVVPPPQADAVDTPLEVSERSSVIHTHNDGSVDISIDTANPTLTTALPSPSASVDLESNTHHGKEMSSRRGEVTKQGAFRAGVLTMIHNPRSLFDLGGLGIVADIAEDVDDIFMTLDKDSDGSLDREEIKALFIRLDIPITSEKIDILMDQLDTDKNGTVSKDEFRGWYINYEEVLKKKVRELFDYFDEDKTNDISRDEIRALLQKLEGNVTEKDVDDALKEISTDENTNSETISFNEFNKWYYETFLHKHIEEFESMPKIIIQNLTPPKKASCYGYVTWVVLLPLICLNLTIPDVRRKGWHKFCYLSFLLSIFWIGVYSYLLLYFTETIGRTIGIPDVVMGLTFLAAGTSLPDLLSSVIVARRGQGDMAVSSSIGSNIFDILVGLPVPWLVFTIINTFSSYGGEFVAIGIQGVWWSILILVGMIALVILTIALCGWRLSKSVGAIMMVLYFAYVAQAVVQELPFKDVCS